MGRPVDEDSKPVRKYRRRMHNVWKEHFEVIAEQCLCEQEKVIRKTEWTTKLELENIRRKVL